MLGWDDGAHKHGVSEPGVGWSEVERKVEGKEGVGRVAGRVEGWGRV